MIGRWRLDTSSSARIQSWKTGLIGWAERPLTGYGVANYLFMDAQYMRILTEAGILGLAAFAWLAWAIWRMAITRFRNASDPFSKALSLGYLAGYLAMLVHGIGANTFIIVRIMEPFWLLTALVVALPEVNDTEYSRAA
jgi:O-antigen ligase